MTDPAEPATATATHPTDQRDTAHLRGSLGTTRIVFLVVAAASPLIVVAGAVPVMLAIGNGAGVPFTYLLVAVVLLVFSVGYTAMSRHIPDAGAFYAYISAGLGRVTGTGAAGLALLTYTAVQTAVYGLAGAVTGEIAAVFTGIEAPWWVWSGLLLAVVGVLGYRNIELGIKILAVLLTLELAILAVVSGAILLQGGAEGFDAVSFTPAAFLSGAPGIAVVFAVASFIGFEATAIYSEEARDPGRTVPKATYAGVILIGVFYTVASWAIVLAFGSAHVREAAGEDIDGLTFAAAHAYAGPGVALVMELLLVASLFTALLAFHNAVARYLFSLGRAGQAPAPLGQVHARHGSPANASLVQTGSAVVVLAIFAVAGSDPVLHVFTWFSGLATLGVLVLMALVGVAVLAFFARTRADTRIWHTRVAPVLGTVGVSGLLLLVLANFTTLIEGSAALASVFVGLVVGAFVVGAVFGARGRQRTG